MADIVGTIYPLAFALVMLGAITALYKKNKLCEFF